MLQGRNNFVYCLFSGLIQKNLTTKLILLPIKSSKIQTLKNYKPIIFLINARVCESLLILSFNCTTYIAILI